MDAGEQRPVVIAYDGSGHARAAVAAAADLLAGRPAVVATVWLSVEQTAPMATLGMPAGAAREAAQDLDAERREAAEALAAEGAELARGAGLDARPAALCGRTTAAPLCELADELDAPAVVAGARGRSGMAAAVLGSVSGSLLQHAGRPVLLVHADG